MNRMYSMHATPDKRTSDPTKVSDISIYKDSTQAMGPTHVTDDTRNVMSTENMASIGAKRNTDNTDVKSVTNGMDGVHGTNYVDGKDNCGTTDATDATYITDFTDEIPRIRNTNTTPASLPDHWSRLGGPYCYAIHKLSAILRREAATEPLVPSILKKIVVSFCVSVGLARATLALINSRFCAHRPTDVKINMSISSSN